jgi:hypothetical protein
MSEAVFDETTPFDWSPLGEEIWRAKAADAPKRVRINEKRLRFAVSVFRHGNMSAAARDLGLGTENTVRQIASSLGKTLAVRWLLTEIRASAGRGALPDDFLSDDEMEQILTKQARSGSSTDRRNAIALLRDVRRDRADEKRRDEEAQSSPEKTLDEIASLDPVLALALAKKHQIQWKPTEAQLGAIDKALRRCVSCGSELKRGGARVDEQAVAHQAEAAA